MRLVSPNSLSGAEKLVFDNLKGWFPSGAVCVNVMVGGDPWDLRPLLLVDGKVTLYRFSRPLKSDTLDRLAAELQGFVVVPGWETRTERREGQERLLLVRPFFQSTLADLLKEAPRGPRRHELVADLISVARELNHRRLVHGHISPSNITEVGGRLVLLDPRLGAFHNTRDAYLAPESVAGEEPDASVDLFGLGCVIDDILGDDATHQQRQVIDRLRLPSPRQRPTLEEVEREFVRRSGSLSSGTNRPGRVISKSRGTTPAPSGKALSAEVGTVERSRRSGVSFYLLSFVVIGAVGLAAVRYASPRLFNDLCGGLAFVARSHNEEFDLAWASNEKAQMRIVARAAVLEHDPAAENTIIQDTLSGENRPGVNGQLLRVALNKSWAESLTRRDRQVAIALAVQQLYPDGIKDLPPFESLSPGVLLAVIGQMQPAKGTKEIKAMSIDRLAALPAPIGKTFAQLKSSGTTSLGAPETIALAGMVSGNPPLTTVEAYIGGDSPTPLALSRLAIALPLLTAQEPIATQLLQTIRDRGGELGQVLSWFDIDALGLWAKVRSADKLALLLGELPVTQLTVQHYADLLTFPLVPVRGQSAKKLASDLLKGETEQLFVVLANDQNRLSRDQTVALLSALSLDPSKRGPFIASWYELKPPTEMVLLVLLARSNRDANDLFNLEAARYLRKGTWAATTEMLQIMARHPEPLARSLAYMKLSTREPSQKAVLQQRVSEERDPGLLKALTTKLSPPPPPPVESVPVLSTPAP